MQRGVTTVLLVFALLICVCASLPSGLKYKLEYSPSSVRCASPHVHITITLPDDAPEGTLELVIPNAIPSGYETQPYDAFVGNLTAKDRDGNNLTVTKDSGPVWRIYCEEDDDESKKKEEECNEKDFAVKTIHYSSNLKHMEMSILDGGDSSRIRTGFVGVLGVSVFAYIEGLEEMPIELIAEGPKDWPIFSTLAPQNPPSLHKVKACCNNFYELADSQIAMGPDMEIIKHTVTYSKDNKKVPVYLAVYSEGDLDMAKVGHLAEMAMRGSLEWIGKDSPFPTFTYFIQLVRPLSPSHYYGWSLEHLQSATLVFSDDGGVKDDSNTSVINRHLYNLVHHTLHAWIPKRCYGEHYYPFTWQVGPAFDSIWFSEGFVQYVAALVTRNLLEDDIEKNFFNRNDSKFFFECLMDRRFKTPVNSAPEFISEMDLVYLSYVASTQYSKNEKISSNLYARGALMAEEMDTMIKARTEGWLSLRDALQWTIAWSDTHKKSFRIDQLPEFFLTATGVDTTLLYRRWLKAPGDRSFPFYVLPSQHCDSVY